MTMPMDESRRSIPAQPPAGGGARSGEGEKFSYSITDLAREFGVSLRALRFYEDKDLLAPLRRGQSRIYSRRDRARLKLILQGKRVGFSLAEIKEMLDLYDLEDGQEAQMRVALGKFRERIETLKRQQKDIEAAVTDLENACSRIENLLSESGGREGRDGVNIIGYAVSPGADRR
ncbi:MAG: MerR family transcriptional regulator [Alphaproteobacteria bacterium]